MSQLQSHQIGDATVVRVTECRVDYASPAGLFPDWTLEPDLREEAPALADLLDPVALSIHTWIVRTPRHTLLIDTGVGNDKPRATKQFDHMQSPFLERLSAVGVTPESVDHVLLTHIHTDHVGWNTRRVDGRWVPTFPNARHHVPRAGFDWFAAGPGRDAPNRAIFDDSILPVVEAGLVDFVDAAGGEVLPGFTFVPTPGHSVDHMSIRFSSGGAEALFAGDLMHHPVQVRRPDWCSVFCADPQTARQSRRAMLADCADRGVLWFSSHFPDTSAGRVSHRAGGFAWRFV